MAFFLFVSERNLNGEAAAEKVSVRPIHVWWRQRDSNPRGVAPKRFSRLFDKSDINAK